MFFKFIKMSMLCFFIVDISADSPLFISLGSNCQPCIILKNIGLRKSAYPFDWMLSLDIQGIIKLLEDDFMFFLDRNYLERHSLHSYAVCNTYYNIEFRHDWPILFLDPLVNFLDTLEDVKNKYQRRIKRFRELNEYGGEVFFIRVAFDPNADPVIAPFLKPEQKEISYEEAVLLKRALDDFFPKLNFKLVVINLKNQKSDRRKNNKFFIEYNIKETTPWHKLHSSYERIYQDLLDLSKINYVFEKKRSY